MKENGEKTSQHGAQFKMYIDRNRGRNLSVCIDAASTFSSPYLGLPNIHNDNGTVAKIEGLRVLGTSTVYG